MAVARSPLAQAAGAVVAPVADPEGRDVAVPGAELLEAVPLGDAGALGRAAEVFEVGLGAVEVGLVEETVPCAGGVDEAAEPASLDAGVEPPQPVNTAQTSALAPNQPTTGLTIGFPSHQNGSGQADCIARRAACPWPVRVGGEAP